MVSKKGKRTIAEKITMVINISILIKPLNRDL
jgi:hypothetical protein